jgi:hypothetical protein
MKIIKKFLLGVVVISLLLANVDMVLNTSLITNTVEAHSGRTDSSGGHKDNKNKSGLGSYHYHCGGNPAHLHKNGVCPYDSSSSDDSSSDEIKITKSIIKKVQTALKELGYNCGKIDGSLGKNTKKALKSYQEDYSLKVDGVIGKEVLDSLDINYN